MNHRHRSTSVVSRGPVLSLLVSLILSGCIFEDTCSGGENMTDPRMLGAFDATAEEPLLRIGWDVGSEQGARLPESYFQEVEVAHLTDDAVDDLVDEVSYVAEREIQVQFTSLVDYAGENDTLSVVLRFPDRQGFIDCTHPGMMDRYYLEVVLSFDPATGALADVTFEQYAHYGAF